METFDEWFASLSEKEQKEYFEEQKAELYIDEYKENYFG